MVSCLQHPAAAQDAALASRVVVIDPGHGGENEGCMGFHGVLEKYVTLQVSLRLAALLQAEPGWKVRLTRGEDAEVGLRERTRFAAEWGADLFLSIHANAALHDRAEGIETYFLSAEGAIDEAAQLGPLPIGEARTEGKRESEQGEERRDPTTEALLMRLRREASPELSAHLAQVVHSELLAATRAADRGVKQADFAVLREAIFPAVVVELGFLTHPVEGLKLMLPSYQDTLAKALARAVVSFPTKLPPGASLSDPAAMKPSNSASPPRPENGG